LKYLGQNSRDRDSAIAALAEKAVSAQLTIRRLKKQKLALKDRIARIEDHTTPDNIA